MRSLKKPAFLFLCTAILLILLSALSYKAEAASVTYPVEGGNLYFDPDTQSIIGCDKTITVANIPEMINGVRVAAIQSYAFVECFDLVSVTIPEGVFRIGSYAFEWCISLTSITIPASVTIIDGTAFGACSSLTGIWVSSENKNYSSDDIGVLFDKDKKTLIQCGGGMTGSYTVPDSVISIFDSAFYACMKLTSVTIPESVTSIGERAFYNCENLINVVIPDSVSKIGDSAFMWCTGLTNVTIGNGVTTIGAEAFQNCSDLKNLIIGDKVTTIKQDAFSYCDSLISVTIPDSVTKIGNSAFYSCDALMNVVIPNSVTSIGITAFAHCSNLRNVTVPASVSSFGYGPFSGCDKLKGIWVDPENKYYSNDDMGVMFDKDKKKLVQCGGAISGSYTVPDSVTTICKSAFIDCHNLTNVIIPDSVTTIEATAFFESGLTSVTIPDSVKTIGQSVFHWCYDLTSVTLGKGITTIPYGTFRGSGLTSVSMGNNVTTIDNYAFADCANLISVIIEDSVTTIGTCAFQNCYSLTDLTIGNSVTTIGARAFEYCYDLASVTIGDSVTSIDKYVFYSCNKLMDVYYVSTEEMWNEIAIAIGNDPLLNASIHFNHGVVHTDENIRIYHTLDLAGDIAINYIVPVDALEGYDDFYMECLVPNYEGNQLAETVTVVLKPELRGSLFYFVLDDLVSFEMNNIVAAKLFMHKGNDDYVSLTDRYSIATYAYGQLNNKSSSPELKAVCANLLQYGAKAQLWKEYRTDALADATMTEEHRAYLTDPKSVIFENNKKHLQDFACPPVSFVGIPLRLDSRIAVRFVIDTTGYTGALDDLNLRISYTDIEGVVQTAIVTELEEFSTAHNYYAFSFDGLLAAELRTVLSVVVYSEDQRISETMEYSVDTYGNNKTGTLLILVQSMIAYSDSAKIFFSA